MACSDLQLSPGGGALPDKERRFESGLLDLRKRQGLYVEQPGGVEITDGVLYRARIAIPSQVPVGTYTAETFLVDRGKVIAAATREIEVGKAGFERFVALAARQHAFALRPRRGHALARPWLGRRPPFPPSHVSEKRTGLTSRLHLT